MQFGISAATLPGDSPTPLGSSPLPYALFYFLKIFFGATPGSTTPPHAPIGPGFATLRESNLLFIVKPQHIVPYPHLKLYLVVWHGWVGLVTTGELLSGILKYYHNLFVVASVVWGYPKQPLAVYATL